MDQLGMPQTTVKCFGNLFALPSEHLVSIMPSKNSALPIIHMSLANFLNIFLVLET